MWRLISLDLSNQIVRRKIIIFGTYIVLAEGHSVILLPVIESILFVVGIFLLNTG